MTLTNDLRLIIFSYLPLTKIQILQDQGLSLLNNVNFLTNLLVNKYNINKQTITASFDNKHQVLTNFDVFARLAMLTGDIGYNGQWYLPVLICLAYAIENRNKDLLNYYLLRFVNKNKMTNTMKVLDQDLFTSPYCFTIILYFLASNDTSILSILSDAFGNQIDNTRPATIDLLDNNLVLMIVDKIEKYKDQQFPRIEPIDIAAVLDEHLFYW